MVILAGVLAILAAASPQAAAAAWVDAPTYAQAAAAYPAKAKAAHVAGDVLFTCTVAYGGRLSDCAALREEPAGLGFAAAARKVAQGGLRTSAPPHSEVQVAVSFRPEMATGAAYVAADPVWLSLPTAADFQAAFPKSENGVNKVKVVLLCDVAPAGALAGCTVESDDPAGQGYGAAALALAPKIRVGLVSAGGTPLVGAKVRVPIRYEMTPASAANP